MIRLRRTLPSTVVPVLVALTSAAAVAAEPRYHAWGPVAYALSVTVDELGYQGDVFTGSPEEQPDLVLSVTPRGYLRVPLRSDLRLDVDQAFGIGLFAEHSELDRVDRDTGGSLRWERADGWLSGWGRATRSQQRPDDEIDAELRRDRGSFGLTGGFDRGGPLRATIELTASEESYSGADTASALDRETRRAQIDLGYRVLPRTEGYLRVEQLRLDYRETGGPLDSDWLHPELGLRTDPDAWLQLDLRSGRARVEVPGDATQDRALPSWFASVERRLVRRFSVELAFESDPRTSSWERNAYYRRRHATLILRQTVWRRLGLEAALGRSRHRYPVGGRRDTVLDLALSGSVAIGRSMRVGLTFGHWERDSNLLGLDRRRIGVSGFLSRNF